MVAKLFVVIVLVGCVTASHLGDHLYEAPSTLSASPLSTSYGVPIPSNTYLEAPTYTAPSTTTNVQTVHYTKPSVKTLEYAVPVTTYQYVKKNVVTQEPATAQITYQVPSIQSEKFYYVPLKDAKVYYVNKAVGGSVANTASSSLSYNVGGLSSYSSTGLSSGLSGLSYSNLGGSSLSVGSLGSSGLDLSGAYAAGSPSGLSYSSLGGSGWSSLGNSGWGQSSSVW